MGNKHWVNTWTEIEELGGGKFAAEIHVGHKVFKDKTDGQYKKHKLTDERLAKDYVLIQSAKCCMEVYPYYAKYFDVDHEEVRLYEERWVVQRWRDPPGKWQDIGAWNPQITIEEYPKPAGDVLKVTITYDTDYGELVVEYFQRDGNALKHNVTFTNTSGSTETFRVLQRWSGIVGDKCNGQDFPLVTEDSYLAFHNSDKPKKKFNIAENLHSMIFNPDGSEKTDQCLQRPINIETHTQGMKADFIYGDWVLAQNASLEIDPNISTLDNPTEDGYITYRVGVGFGRTNTDTDLLIGFYALYDQTFRAYVEWNVSGIPEGATITDTVFKYHGELNNIDCHIHEMVARRPLTSTDQQVFDEIGGGTIYAAPTGFPVVATNQQVDLGAPADSDLESQLSVGWFAIGMQSDNEGASATTYIYSEEGSGSPAPTLYVEYTTPDFEYVGTGTFAYSGTATTTIGFAYAGSGELTYSGTAEQSHTCNFSYIASGDFVTSGSGICQYEKSEWEYVGSGELSYSGEATQSHTKYFLYDTSGNFVFSGAGVYSLGFAYICSGSLIYSGEATQFYTKVFSYMASGELSFSGTGTYFVGFSFVGSGTCNFSGVGLYSLGLFYVGIGEFVYSGSATQVHTLYYLYAGSGVFAYSGKAVLRWGDWAEIEKKESDFQEVTKETSDFVVVGKKGSDWTKIDKEKGDWEEIDEE